MNRALSPSSALGATHALQKQGGEEKEGDVLREKWGSLLGLSRHRQHHPLMTSLTFTALDFSLSRHRPKEETVSQHSILTKFTGPSLVVY
jgi:hypothetical protein